MTDVATPPAGGRPLLVARDVRRWFGGVHAVDGASLDVRERSVTALIGPNGAGKTSLFNVLTGFYRAQGGEVTYDGARITNRPPEAIARLGMVRTFQITKALAGMSVLDNVMLAARDQPGEHLWNLLARPRAVRRRERAVRERALETLETFDLRKRADEYAGILSGGQRKLLELARALMVEPRCVLLDEPMAGINPSLGHRLMDYVQQLRGERGMTFLIIEHDMEVVMRHADRVIVMAQGKVIADGTPDDVRHDERVVDAYLGSQAEVGA